MRIFKSVKKKTRSFSDQSLEGSCCGVAWKVWVKGQSGSFERGDMVLRAIETSSEKTDVCECYKYLVFINQLKLNGTLKCRELATITV